jgi:hypothetical protein
MRPRRARGGSYVRRRWTAEGGRRAFGCGRSRSRVVWQPCRQALRRTCSPFLLRIQRTQRSTTTRASRRAAPRRRCCAHPCASACTQRRASMDAAAAHEASEAPALPACVSEARALLEEAHSSGALFAPNAAESARMRCHLLPALRSSVAARLAAKMRTRACSGADAPRRRRRDVLRGRCRRRCRAGGAPRGRRRVAGRRRGGDAARPVRRGSRVAAVRRCVAHSARNVP